MCPKDEVKQHAVAEATVLSCDAKGISATRDWIMNHAKKEGHARVVMLDDDLTLQKRRPNGKITNLEGVNEFTDAFGWLDDALRKYAHAGFTPRFLEFDKPASVKEQVGKRMMYVLGYNVKQFFEAKASFTRGLPDMPTMEDFHVTLQLIRAGMPNLNSLVWRVHARVSNASGGCSTWRTLERHNRSAERLVKLHAPFVKLRVADTEWKGEGMKEGVKRKEVTVYWQKAMKAGVSC